MTTHIYTRTLIYAVVAALLLTSCASSTQQTAVAVQAQARDLVAAQMAATLVAGRTVEEVGSSLWAIDRAVAGTRGAFMLLNDVQKIAVFIAPAGKTASGTTYYLTGFVDVAHNCIIDANRTLIDFGIDPRRITTLEEMRDVLRTRGFVELTAASAPTLLGTLRLALGFIRSIGGTLTDVMIMPVYPLIVPVLYDAEGIDS